MSMQPTAIAPFGQLERALSSLRIPAVPGEYDLHALIAQALQEAGLPVRHEVRLAPRCRIDFVVDGVGIEVKKGKPVRAQLTRQVHRYLNGTELTGLLLVVERTALLPSQVAGKPVKVLGLNRLWGVALS